MSRFPYTRMSLAKIFANLTLLAIPRTETACLDVGFAFYDLLKARTYTIKVKGQEWKAEGGRE